jgi:hypothetical protein
MPLIRIDYDGAKVSDTDALDISNAAQKIVSEATGIEDVFVYANDSHIKVKTAPIEIFVEMSAHKIQDADELIALIKKELSAWKASSGFAKQINLTLIPMAWKVEIDI